ncbi:hypothetical protein HC928_25210 [bacterium]|nr:hypothetical protein [bacterium]
MASLTHPARRSKSTMYRLRKWFETSGWYVLLLAFTLVTIVPFLWTALMSVRPNSANVFRPNQPPQLLPYPGLVGWGEGQREATSEGALYRPALASG